MVNNILWMYQPFCMPAQHIHRNFVSVLVDGINEADNVPVAPSTTFQAAPSYTMWLFIFIDISVADLRDDITPYCPNLVQ